jgi:hypothetical protein
MYGMTFGEAEDTSTPIFDIREVASGMVRGSYASGSEAYQAAKQLSAAAGGVEVGVYVSGRKLFSYINGHMVGLNGPNLGDPVDMLALQQQAQLGNMYEDSGLVFTDELDRWRQPGSRSTACGPDG